MVKEIVRKEAWAVNASKEGCISDFTSVSLMELEEIKEIPPPRFPLER